MGAARVAGAPGLHRELRRDLSRPGPTDVSRSRHHALREERLLDPDGIRDTRRAGAFHPDVGDARRGRPHPGYQQLEIDDELLRGGLVTIASGMPRHSDHTAITIHNKHAALHGARMQPVDNVELPEAQYLHLFVARGQVTLEGAGPIHEGDAVRFTASGGQRVTATEPAEILVWEMHASLAAA